MLNSADPVSPVIPVRLVVSVLISAGQTGQTCIRKEKSFPINCVSHHLIVASSADRTCATCRDPTRERQGTLAMFSCFFTPYCVSVSSGGTKTSVAENRRMPWGAAQAVQPWRCNISCHSKRGNNFLFLLGDMRETDGNIKSLQGRLNTEHSVFWSSTRCWHSFYCAAFQKSFGWSLFSYFCIRLTPVTVHRSNSVLFHWGSPGEPGGSAGFACRRRVCEKHGWKTAHL